MSKIMAPASPRFAHQRDLARTLLGKRAGRRGSLNGGDEAPGAKSPGSRVSDAPEFLRREQSLDAVLGHHSNRLGSPRRPASHESEGGALGSPGQLERGGSLSLDFLRRESSLEALRFITSSPGSNKAPSRTVSLDLAHAKRTASAGLEKGGTGGALAALANAAGMKDGVKAVMTSPASGRVKHDMEPPDAKMAALYRQESAETLLRACKDLESDDDSDEDSPTKAGKRKAAFPKPDFGIFQQAPPLFPDGEGAARSEFDSLMDIGEPDDGHVEPVGRTKQKKAKRIAARDAFRDAAQGKRTNPVASGLTAPAGPSGVPNANGSKMIGKLTVEERKARIAKFLDKRTRRRWGKKVEYECRKKLAVQRVRVHGRFA